METYGDLGIAHFNNPAPAFTVVTAHIWKSVYLGVRVGVQDPGSGLQPTYNWDIEPYIACIYIYRGRRKRNQETNSIFDLTFYYYLVSYNTTSVLYSSLIVILSDECNTLVVLYETKL